jgi:hypothetical protein
MDHAVNPDPHTHAAAQAEQPYFPAAEWARLRQEDYAAAQHIVGLMLGIFGVGLLLYASVAWWVATWPA